MSINNAVNRLGSRSSSELRLCHEEELLEGTSDSHPFDCFLDYRPFLSLESTRRNLLRGICIHKLLSSSFHFLPFMTV